MVKLRGKYVRFVEKSCRQPDNSRRIPCDRKKPLHLILRLHTRP